MNMLRRAAAQWAPACRSRLSTAAAADAAAPVTCTVTADGIAVVKFDAPGEKVNTLSAKAFAAFEGVLTRLETDPAIKAAVLISGKPDGFIAGADITMLVCMVWRLWCARAPWGVPLREGAARDGWGGCCALDPPHPRSWQPRV